MSQVVVTKFVDKINKMSPEDLKTSLIKMIKDNINLGIELFDRKE